MLFIPLSTFKKGIPCISHRKTAFVFGIRLLGFSSSISPPCSLQGGVFYLKTCCPVKMLKLPIKYNTLKFSGFLFIIMFHSLNQHFDSRKACEDFFLSQRRKV